MEGLLTTMICKNLKIIGNCLGTTKDLQKAIDEYVDGELLVPIDSIYSGERIGEFFCRSFSERDKFGKVIYKYGE